MRDAIAITLGVILVYSFLAWVIYITFRTLILFPFELYKTNANARQSNLAEQPNFKQLLGKYKSSIIAFIIIISPYLYFKHTQEMKWKTILPVELETNGSVLIHESFDFREGCSVGIFKLSDSTLKSINSNGFKFFKHATKPRNPETKNHEYENWSIIDSIHMVRKYNNYTVDLINCERELDKDTINELYAASVGGYVTYYRGASLVVLPSLGYVVYSHGS